MSSGAYALYVDLSAGSGGGGGGGGGNNAPILRSVPLPHLSGDVRFENRRLTLVYDARGFGPDPLDVEFQFIDNGHAIIGGGTMPVTIGCNDLDTPRDACMVSFLVMPLTPAGPRGALTALVEYSD